MTKLIIIILSVVGFFALSMAFFPAVWNKWTWVVPMTTFQPSWGLVLTIGIIWLGMGLKS